MLWKMKTLVFIFSCITPLLVFAEISNVQVAQRRDGSKLMDIYYDLTGNVEQVYSMEFYWIPENNQSQKNKIQSITGAVANISPGVANHAIWDMNIDLPNYHNHIQIQVKIADSNNASIQLSDDFSQGFSNWIQFGSPSSQIVDIHGKSKTYDNNGNSFCNSGIISKESIDISKETEIQAEVFMQVDNYNGCWVEIIIGLSHGDRPSSGVCINEDFTFWPLVSYKIIGDQCWQAPSDKKRHTFIDGGGFDSYHFKADSLVNNWQTLKVVIDADKYADIYIGDTHVGKSNTPIDSVFQNAPKLYLGGRSSGLGGKVYLDNPQVK